METIVHTDRPVAGDGMSAASWASIAAGAVATAALTSRFSPWGPAWACPRSRRGPKFGVSAATFKTGTGIFLVLVAVMSSAIGGYLAAHLRARWVGFGSDEVFFRDTAHGFIAWAFATVLSAAALGAATTQILGGAATGIGTAAGQAAASVNPAQVYVDRLFRADAAPPAQAPGANDNARARAEVTRLWTSASAETANLPPRTEPTSRD